MFKRIMVPTDGSEHAKDALKKAVELQKLCGAELFILSVYRHYGLLEKSLSMVRPEDPENIDDALQAHSKTMAEDFKKLAVELGSDKPRAFVKSGHPARTIVKFADDKEIDLIVLGSRGLGDVDGFLLGSVSHKVTSLAKCPVMVI